MGRLTAKLLQSAYKISTGRNEYNDVQYTTSSTAIPCMYRDISLTQQAGNSEQTTLDGQLWFDADAVVAKGDVFLLESQYLRIERVIPAKPRLRSNAVAFIKTEVSKQRQIS